ncbi:MAG TPA: 6-carboxytetrahydropterin synthase QueD [Candidatus Omnitrophica bacterium]|nr:MAG: 6-carboxytetrahydropterin synthase QueD [Candidatus Omnitrophota bacterium]RKY44124.1 MAG: 6-carboxytetrahydropterin synthase QueD [Candidatus Omnitrophota bacterium]HEC69200.1 6-carboxytetrahydropterin synthase QueD [Candidatus Omnitrophota bacterium]
MYKLKVTSFFSSAHSLRGYKGKCESLHGHNWKVEIVVQKDTLSREGLVIDFKELKALLKKVLVKLDHKNLNTLSFFKKHNPSSENIAYFIYKELKSQIAKRGCKLKEVIVSETEDSCASFFEEG